MMLPTLDHDSPDPLVLEDLAWRTGSVCLLVLDAQGSVLRLNAAASSALKPLSAGARIWDVLPGDGSGLRERMEEARTAPVRGFRLNFSDGASYALSFDCSLAWMGGSYVMFAGVCFDSDQRMKDELMGLTRELAESNRERAKVAAELRRTLAELQTSHWHIRRIQEFLTACCVCNKIRVTPGEDGAVWQSLTAFLAENGLLMSHGYCPECEAKVLADVDAVFPFH